jgi:hypothetical protein
MGFRKMKREGARRKDILQFHSNCAVTGDSWGGLYYFNREDTETKWFPLDADPEIQEAIHSAIVEFWPSVDSGIPPEQAKLETEVKIPDAGGEVKPITDDRFAFAFDDYDQACAIIKEAEELKQSAKAALEILMAENEAKVAEGFGRRIFCREQAGRKSLDKEALQREYPELDLRLFQKVGSPSTYFRIFKVKE